MRLRFTPANLFPPVAGGDTGEMSQALGGFAAMTPGSAQPHTLPAHASPLQRQAQPSAPADISYSVIYSLALLSFA